MAERKASGHGAEHKMAEVHVHHHHHHHHDGKGPGKKAEHKGGERAAHEEKRKRGEFAGKRK